MRNFRPTHMLKEQIPAPWNSSRGFFSLVFAYQKTGRLGVSPLVRGKAQGVWGCAGCLEPGHACEVLSVGRIACAQPPQRQPRPAQYHYFKAKIRPFRQVSQLTGPSYLF